MDKLESDLVQKSVMSVFLTSTFLVSTLLLLFFLFGFVGAADPVGPDELISVSNETKAAVGARVFNVSGGYISTFNLSATTQNPRWKGFVGNVTGSFTLDDASGSTIYDWTLSSVTGRIYTTRNSTSVTWSSMTCSNRSLLEQENVWLSHNNTNDNLTSTFNVTTGATHSAFYVASSFISANSCPTLNTYKNNASQDTDFEEITLIDNKNITVFATIMEENVIGFDGGTYDFQMIVPENGSATWSNSLAYYLYIELGS